MGVYMRIVGMVRQVLSASTDVLFSARCTNCNREGDLICDRCLDEATRLTSDSSCQMCALPTEGSTLCGRCSSDPPPVSSLVAAFAFDGAIRSSIHALKYDGLRAVAPALGDEMADRWGTRRKLPDVVLPIPLHRSRLRSRGYNQSELLARPVSARLGVPMDTGLLRRVVDTPSQAAATDEAERAKRVKGVFEAVGEVKDLHFLLIDDVATAGSTINSAAHTLLDAGAWGVSALVLAREL
jgi:competence protein ComFC